LLNQQGASSREMRNVFEHSKRTKEHLQLQNGEADRRGGVGRRNEERAGSEEGRYSKMSFLLGLHVREGVRHFSPGK